MATKLPEFTYTGSYKTEMKNGCWYIFFLTGGTLTMTYGKSAQVYLHGGGGGSGLSSNPGGGGGGAGGYFGTYDVSIVGGQPYPIVVGGGGAAGQPWVDHDRNGGTGGTSTAFGKSAAGGVGGKAAGNNAGNGGAGGTGGSGNGGRGGDSTGGSAASGGNNTTYAFNDPSCGLIYGGGGSGGAPKYGGGANGGSPYGAKAATAAAANTGAGAGGANYTDDISFGQSGGSGIVILRSTQDDQLPVVYDGTRLTQMHFNGTQLTGLVYNGVRLFIKRLEERLASGIRGRRKEGKKRHGGIVYGTGGA